MTDIEIMNYFLRFKKKNEEWKISELTINKAGEILVTIGDYAEPNDFTPEFFNKIKEDIERTYTIQSTQYGAGVNLIIAAEEIKGEKE